jgi:hypothetical protein
MLEVEVVGIEIVREHARWRECIRSGGQRQMRTIVIRLQAQARVSRIGLRPAAENIGAAQARALSGGHPFIGPVHIPLNGEETLLERFGIRAKAALRRVP